MKLKIFEIDNKCTGCGACVSACPKACLKLGSDEYGFFYPKYDSNNCIECGLCEKVCHVVSSSEKEPVNKENFYFYVSDDIQVVQDSSSGGAFTMFSEYVIKQGGVVFGSWYNGNTKRLEVGNSETVDWTFFRKSKYIESFMGNTCQQIVDYLRKGRLVLFCGTPCQVKGIRHYLDTRKINTENLILVDFVCHGVPTNMLFQSFLKKYNYQDTTSAVDFRYKDFSKNYGWHDLYMRLTCNNSKYFVIPYRPPYSFYYLKPFADDCAHRICCFDCHHLDYSSADITIGDFWGVEKYDKTLDKNQGISLIKLNTQSILPLWDEIQEKECASPISYEYASYIYNKKHRNNNLQRRNKFLAALRNKGLNHAVFAAYPKELIDYYTIGQVKEVIKKIIKRK